MPETFHMLGSSQGRGERQTVSGRRIRSKEESDGKATVTLGSGSASGEGSGTPSVDRSNGGTILTFDAVRRTRVVGPDAGEKERHHGSSSASVRLESSDHQSAVDRKRYEYWFHFFMREKKMPRMDAAELALEMIPFLRAFDARKEVLSEMDVRAKSVELQVAARRKEELARRANERGETTEELWKGRARRWSEENTTLQDRSTEIDRAIRRFAYFRERSDDSQAFGDRIDRLRVLWKKGDAKEYRRDQEPIFDEHGDPYVLDERLRLFTASSAVEKQLGAEILYDPSHREALKGYFVDRYAPFLRKALFAGEFGISPDMFGADQGTPSLDAGEEVAVQEFIERYIERAMKGYVERHEHAEHIGHEPSEAHRRRYVAERLYEVFRAAGIFSSFDMRWGELREPAVVDRGEQITLARSDIAYVEEPEIAKPLPPIALFTLYSTDPSEWKSVLERSGSIPKSHLEAASKALPKALAEIARFQFLIQEVGGGENSMLFDPLSGRWVLENTGKAFSVAAAFDRFPESIKKRLSSMSSASDMHVVTAIHSLIRPKSVAAEIADAQELPLDGATRSAMREFLELLEDKKRPEFRILKDLFSIVFRDPMIAECEMNLWIDRLRECELFANPFGVLDNPEYAAHLPQMEKFIQNLVPIAKHPGRLVAASNDASTAS